MPKVSVVTNTIILDSKEQFNLLSTQQVEQEPLKIWEVAQTLVPSAKFFHHKPQIVSIPGVSPKERLRYRVTLENQIIADQLTIDEALKLANQSTHH